MKRRNLLALGAAVLIVPARPAAQQRGRIYRVGLLGVSSPTPEVLEVSLVPFRQRLRELGWVEGQNVVIEQRWAQGRRERYPELAAELVRLKVDVIVTPSSEAATGARKASQTIPIVGTFLGDPVKFGLVQSYARPGGNVTGLTSEVGGLPIAAKTLELLKLAVPSASRIAILVNPRSEFAYRLREDIELAAKALQVELVPVEAREPEQLEQAFARMREARVEALYVLADSIFFAQRARIAELAVKHRIPMASAMALFAQAGGLMSYVMDLSDNYRRAAEFVDKIFKGANPAVLPVEQPTKFELHVNLKTARALGLTLPPGFLLRADRVIE